MKFLLAMSLTSTCLVLVSARSIRRRETIEKLFEFKVAVPFLLSHGSRDVPLWVNHVIR